MISMIHKSGQKYFCLYYSFYIWFLLPADIHTDSNSAEKFLIIQKCNVVFNFFRVTGNFTDTSTRRKRAFIVRALPIPQSQAWRKIQRVDSGEAKSKEEWRGQYEHLKASWVKIITIVLSKWMRGILFGLFSDSGGI